MSAVEIRKIAADTQSFSRSIREERRAWQPQNISGNKKSGENMKTVAIIIFSLVFLISCSNEITEPDFEDIIRITSEHYASIHPNPNNIPCDISFSLLQDAHINIIILNSLNETIRELVDGDLTANHYSITWNGRDDNDNIVCSGIYYVKFNVDGFLFREGMCFLK